VQKAKSRFDIFTRNAFKQGALGSVEKRMGCRDIIFSWEYKRQKCHGAYKEQL